MLKILAMALITSLEMVTAQEIICFAKPESKDMVSQQCLNGNCATKLLQGEDKEAFYNVHYENHRSEGVITERDGLYFWFGVDPALHLEAERNALLDLVGKRNELSFGTDRTQVLDAKEPLDLIDLTVKIAAAFLLFVALFVDAVV